jgi:hypothetical protein
MYNHFFNLLIIWSSKVGHESRPEYHILRDTGYDVVVTKSYEYRYVTESENDLKVSRQHSFVSVSL